MRNVLKNALGNQRIHKNTKATQSNTENNEKCDSPDLWVSGKNTEKIGCFNYKIILKPNKCDI